MARVELRPSGIHTYAVVVEDVHENGAWRKKVVRSFGNVSSPSSIANAQQFASALNAGKSLMAASGEADSEVVRKALGLVVGAALAGLAIAWLFKE